MNKRNEDLGHRAGHLETLLTRLKDVRRVVGGWKALCPGHRDQVPSLSIRLGKVNAVLVKCHAGCKTEEILESIGLNMADLFQKTNRSKRLSIHSLAKAKKLPVQFLNSLGVVQQNGHVRIAYRLLDGSIAPRQRRRTALLAKDGSSWFGKNSDGSPVPYGLDRLKDARNAGRLVIVEGESDCWTLWHHGIPALGIPGANNASTLRQEHMRALKNVACIYVFREPGKGGDAFIRGVPARLREMGFKGEIRELTIEGVKDPNDLHRANPKRFKKAFDNALKEATLILSHSSSADAKIKPLSMAGFRKVIDHWLPGTDQTAIEVVFGTVAGQLLSGDPLWLFVVGPPSSGKTELLNPLRDHEAVKFISNLSPAALVSGFRRNGRDDDPSLLPQLDGKTLIVKDFTPLLEMPYEAQAKVFGVLRDVYEGRGEFHFGNDAETKVYKSKFNIIAAVTNAIEKRRKSLVALGERFLYFRPKQMDRRTKSLQALSNANNEEALRGALAIAACRLLAGASTTVPRIPDSMKSEFSVLADLLAIGRTHVDRPDRFDPSHAAIPAPEDPTRIIKQLVRLAQGVAMLNGRETLTAHELGIARRIVFDSLPTARSAILLALSSGKKSVKDISAALRIGETPTRYILEQLLTLGLVTKSKVNVYKTHAARYVIHPDFCAAFDAPKRRKVPTQ